jgi:hypothetical protein
MGARKLNLRLYLNNGSLAVYGTGERECPELGEAEAARRLLAFPGLVKALAEVLIVARREGALTHELIRLVGDTLADAIGADANEPASAVTPAEEGAATPPGPRSLADDSALPPAVREVLAAGRAELEAKRAAEAAERERQRAEIRAATEDALAPAKSLASSLLPASLLPFLDWQTERYCGEFPEDAKRVSTYEPVLSVPGCMPVKLMLRKWVTVHTPPTPADPPRAGVEWVCDGFVTWQWVEGYGPADDSRRNPIPSFPEALALARECWVTKEAEKPTRAA